MGFETKDFIKVSNINHNDIFKSEHFYKDVFEAFTLCKDLKPKNYSNFFGEIVWLNDLFTWKDRVLYFNSWIKSGFLYVKDFYDDEGNFITEQQTLQKLKDRKNWIQEYYIIRSTLSKKLRNIDKSEAKYTNIQYRYTIITNGKFESILDKKSKFYYDTILSKKYTRNKMENIWSETLQINNTLSCFGNIYEERISKIVCRKISEFNFKILNNCLFCGYMVHKWNRNVKEKCILCNVNHTCQHLLYDCERSKEIWNTLEPIFGYKIKWKHIVIGHADNMNNSNITKLKDFTISIIARSIYSFWVKNSENDNSFENENIKTYICRNILFYKNIFEYLDYDNFFIFLSERIIQELL